MNLDCGVLLLISGNLFGLQARNAADRRRRGEKAQAENADEWLHFVSSTTA